MDDIKQRLINCFAIVFPDLSEEEIQRASQAAVASWDSVASITLVNLIEEEFARPIDLDEVVDLVSFELVLAFVTEKHAASASGV